MCYKQYVPSEEFCTMWDECADSTPHRAGWCERSVNYYTVHTVNSEVCAKKAIVWSQVCILRCTQVSVFKVFKVCPYSCISSCTVWPVLHLKVYTVQWSAHKDGDSRPPRRHPSLVSPLLPVASSHTHAFHHAPIKANNKLPNLHIITRCHSFFWDSISSSKTWTVNNQHTL